MTESAVFRGRIFICYRREETAYPAGWLFDRLTEHLGGGQVFKDVDSIEPGDDFVQIINQAIASCDVLLALIGKEWLTISDEEGQRRIDSREDFVRLEIEAALTRNIRVIPILVDKARMPHVDDLPASLAGLARRHALELSPGQFNYDTSRLLKVLNTTLAELGTTQPEADERKPTGWQIKFISRSKAEVIFRLYSGSKQHVIKITRGGYAKRDVIFLDGRPVLDSPLFAEGSILVVDGDEEIRVGIRLLKSHSLARVEDTLTGATFGLIRRVGPVQITVDNVVLYKD